MRQLSVILLFCTAFVPARAAAQLENWQVMELRLNTPTVVARWYGSASPLSRSLNINGGYVALYSVVVMPGLQYSLQLNAPRTLRRVHAYLYDRWPLLPGARQISLPAGPVVLGPHTHRITYRWRVGISSRSSGNLLYVLVLYPRKPGRRRGYAPRIEMRTPASVSTHSIGHDVTYLQGPRKLVLLDTTAQVSYMLHPAVPAQHTQESNLAVPGDLISNGHFYAGLKDWVPMNADGHKHGTPSVSSKGLRLPSTTGVRQQLDADVANAHALMLWADLRLGSSAIERYTVDNGPYIDIEVCYRDAHGGPHCGEQARHIEFYIGKKTVSVNHKTARISQYLPAGRWYHYQVDLLDMKPVPKHIDSIALLCPGRRGTAWVREVHLIFRSKDHATQ